MRDPHGFKTGDSQGSKPGDSVGMEIRPVQNGVCTKQDVSNLLQACCTQTKSKGTACDGAMVVCEACVTSA